MSEIKNSRAVMKAAVFDAFGELPEVREVPRPSPATGSVVLEVKANGICRSDWHAWMGHDPTIQPPHVPGHEMAGVVVETASDIKEFAVGDRVTVPFACGCGTCRYCRRGQLHICEREFQPGFTHWGSFAQFVEIHYADRNLVRLPDTLDFVTAASLGCRFATAYRAIVNQGRANAGDTIAIHGCGGLGLAAVMVANALDAHVVVVDIDHRKLDLAVALGASDIIDATVTEDVAIAIRQLTGGGADISLDALGSRATSWNSIRCLRKQGRHIQVGLLLDNDANPPLPMGRVIACELEVFGSHGMPATDYPDLLGLVTSGRVDPARLVTRTVSLDEAPEVLAAMGEFKTVGAVVIDDFE